jgi:molybdenum cofactor cytidylyltransferase
VDDRRLSLAAVVLAAGAGSRFSDEPGAKLLADLDGQPVLAHVLGEVRAFGPATTIVVLGHGADAIEQTLDWHDEIRVRNHATERGLSSSLQAGIDTLRVLPDAFDGAFIVLGDQPWLQADVMRSLALAAATARSADRVVVVPRYETAGPHNPALLLRPAWSWVDSLEGDQGLAPLLRARPDSVLSVPVSGAMPDVDTAADLVRE